MSWPDNYGRLWGQIPSTAGQVFWVAPSASYTVNGQSYQASDDNDGLAPERALVTVDRAWNLVTADVGDVIVLLPGTHSPAASIAADVAGVTMTGLPGGAGNYLYQKTTIAAVTGDQNINVTAADIEIAYLHWIPVTADSAIDLSAAADRLHIHHCSFDMITAAANVGTMGIDAIGAASNVLIDHCYFECDAAQGPGITAGGLLDSVIEDCDFSQTSGTWAAAITQAAGGRRLIIRRCLFHVGNGTMTVGILGTTGGEVSMAQIDNCIFADSVTNAVDTYDAGDCEIVECYQSGLGATDGGVLITATT
jgi:hypothetical protein